MGKTADVPMDFGRYHLHEYSDGRIHILTQGEDYTVTTRTLMRHARMWATECGLNVKLRARVVAPGQPDQLLIQYVVPDDPKVPKRVKPKLPLEVKEAKVTFNPRPEDDPWLKWVGNQ